ncbi:YchJ family protein [Microbacterium sp. NPDC057659]|uniref:YchJ family protein n=1 Tax=Microbacterium sp. NPDC057659 TaxID=3346198 RepID=UPI00366E06C1
MSKTIVGSARCPCSSGNVYSECCGPIIAGAPAPTAERLMRSRFTAFVIGDEQYLLRSWHPSTRPGGLDLDDATRWLWLEITLTEGGGSFDAEGTVVFVAAYRDASGRGELRERSRFVREGRDWLYVDGDVG